VPQTIRFGQSMQRRPALTPATVSKLIALSLLLLAASGSALSQDFLPAALKALGGVLVAFIVYDLAKSGRVATEVKLYFAFVLWAALSAVVVAADVDLALRHAWTVLQTGVLFWAVAAAHRRQPDLRLVMSGLWAIGLFFALLAWVDADVLATIRDEGGRMSVTGENPNFTGQVFVFAVLGALYLGERAVRWSSTLLALVPIPMFVFMLLFTGSRKMSVAVVIVVAVWLLASERVGLAGGRRALLRVLLILAIATAGVVASYAWDGSAMAERWRAVEETGGQAGLATRERLTEQGLRLFLEYPLAGVGFQNQMLTMGAVAHSDFVDVLASTGLIGALLYFSIYVAAFRRARRVSRGTSGIERLDWGAFLTFTALLLWLMVGFSRYTDFYNIVVLGAFVGTFLGREGRVGQPHRHLSWLRR